MLMADWLCHNALQHQQQAVTTEKFWFDFGKNAKVIELGAGMGVPSLVLAKLASIGGSNSPSHVVLTDCVTSLLDALRQSTVLNGVDTVASVQRLDWRQVASNTTTQSTQHLCSSVETDASLAEVLDVPEADVVIFSEVVYNHQSAKLVPIVCRECLRHGGHVIAACGNCGIPTGLEVAIKGKLLGLCADMSRPPNEPDESLFSNDSFSPDFFFEE